MLSAQHIRDILARAGALPVYQVAILDFLNRAQTPEDIAGPDGSGVGPVVDDPGRFKGRGIGRGYDIGVKVAQRILDRRNELGGRFTDLDQLAGISYFGEDKFNDLVYTFVWRRSPIPSGLGPDFDRYIKALGELELTQLAERKPNTEVLTTLRKVNIEANTRDGYARLDWDEVIPGTSSVQPPITWALHSAQSQSLNTLQTLTAIKAGSEAFDAPILLAGLDARNHAAPIQSASAPVRIGSNLQFATFLQGIATATFLYIQRQGGSQLGIDAEAVLQAYVEAFPTSALIATADAHAIDYEPSHSLSWNLINYYTNRGGRIKRRFVRLAGDIGLGELKEGRFTDDGAELRESITMEALNSAMKILAENGGGSSVQNMLTRRESDPLYVTYKNISAFLTDKFIDEMNLRVSLELFQPAILSWNRLEGRPRTKDFARALRAEVRDPLWFLARQWQVGEFKGEDTGSSVEMRVEMETVPVNRYSLRKGTARPYDGKPPLEAIVERETIDFDLTLSQETGRYWEKLVRRHLNPTFSIAVIDGIVAEYRANPALQFVLPTPVGDYPQIYSDRNLVRHYQALGGGRMLNGAELYRLLDNGATADSFLSAPPAGMPTLLDDARTEFLAWFSDTYNMPVDPGDDAWSPPHLEYQAQFSAPKSSTSRTVLTADEYAQGRLDWYSFDIETDVNNASKVHPSLKSNGGDHHLIEQRVMTVLPGDLRFPGMPLARWWEFEDWKVDLGNIVADTTDVPRLLQTEFALIYSNDWMLLPHDVKVGSICHLKNIVVRDVFGQHTQVRAAGYGVNNDWQRWTMYNLHRRSFNGSPADTRLFVPQAVIKTMESEPLEKVTFLRDEMANMVWAIEATVPDGLGSGRDGKDTADQLYAYLLSTAPPAAPAPPPQVNTAEIQYKLSTSVPEHWIPFIPMRSGSVTSRQIQLRRAAMPRIIPGLDPERIRPRTDLLKEGYDPTTNTWGPYFIHEEEIPRAGAIVTRTWQRARGFDGKVYTWLGRRKQNGRGETNSGLEYDFIVPKKV